LRDNDAKLLRRSFGVGLGLRDRVNVGLAYVLASAEGRTKTSDAITGFPAPVVLGLYTRAFRFTSECGRKLELQAELRTGVVVEE
jgi:hypothetical protein